MTQPSVFDDIVEFPDPAAARRYESLVGLDETKARLSKEARVLLNSALLSDWSRRIHGQVIPLVLYFQNRSPLFLFAGDVGTGKSALAETFGDNVAREERIPIFMYQLSLNARGGGAVGEMTRLVSGALSEVAAAARKGRSDGKKATSGVILMIDEADAVAQSRELDQMHHEDRAGVNALIKGTSALAAEGLPAIVVMCTNRLDAIDPAVRRRAAATFTFQRPTEEQRATVLRTALAGTGLTEEELVTLARETGPTSGRAYGHTYSDLTQRLLPSLLLDAFPDRPISFDRALSLTQGHSPTPPFRAEEGSGS